MPRPSREHSILDAALRCFAEKGYDATRVKDISALAGVSDGALYRHFRSKEDLAQRLYGQTMEAYSDALQEAARGHDAVEQRLERCVRAGLALYQANPNAMTFTLLRQHSFMPTLPEGFAYPIQIIGDLIEEGQAARSVRAGDSKLLAAIFSGCLLRPLIVAQLAGPSSFDLEAAGPHDQVIVDSALAAVRR